MLNNNSTAIQPFIDYLKFEKRYSAHTIISYQTDLLAFYSYLNSSFGQQELGEITPVFIRSWLAGLKDQGLTSKSINRKISTLRSFFKYHLKRGTITTIPTLSVTAPKISKRLPSFIKESEEFGIIKCKEWIIEQIT